MNIKEIMAAIDNEHPLPWHVEEDWTAEVQDAKGGVVMKIEYPKKLWLAQLIVRAVNAYAGEITV